ncbi:class Ib ribonucleoside-diphosphate reductase assembly flavoprotein NrdI [Paenibacillus sp. Mc5Re-14]|uniref:class Ib ribonucleoside-diphosphate reductase assembly flavoprotein NrdI n=1 Tax=Paenibacillus sp. Mc5Re-14 TaxID=1030529 RepID=UPI000A4AC69E|nr:class Ib ribonucleoside-diphosphate reductase assembly flavoprotein NrdI [Paenibacillus sp. Mc5Re-14]
MLILFYSKTGNIRRFSNKLTKRGFVCKDILEHPKVEEDFVLITPTHGFGQIPDAVQLFLRNNLEHLVAVASSGNKVWGNDLFGKSGETIADVYNVPLLHKFQSQGFESDVDIFIERVLSLGKMD